MKTRRPPPALAAAVSLLLAGCGGGGGGGTSSPQSPNGATNVSGGVTTGGVTTGGVTTGGVTTGGGTTGGGTPGGGTTPTPVNTPSVVAYDAPVLLGIPGPRGINDSGQIVGGGSIFSSPGLYQSGPDATVQDLPQYQGQGESPSAINNGGEIVGWSFDQSARLLPGVAWAGPTAAPAVLGPGGVAVTGNRYVVAAVNGGGEIVGDLGDTPVAWSRAGAAPTPLALLPGDATGRATGLNAHGLIVGISSGPDFSRDHPVLWAGASATPQALPGAPNTLYGHLGVNDAGQVYATDLGGRTYFWSSPTAQPVALPGLPGGTPGGDMAGGNAIGPDGTIVGSLPDPAGVHNRAVLWRNGQVQDLNALIPAGSGWTLEDATGINAHGVIIGTGVINGGGYTHTVSGFALTPQ